MIFNFKGSMHPNAKLTETSIKQMKEMHRANPLVKAEHLASVFGTGKNNVLQILRGDRWKHIN